MKQTVLVVLITFYFSSVFAAVPYTFSAGTPAKASEVNGNFTSLDMKISNIQTQVDSISSSGSPTASGNDMMSTLAIGEMSYDYIATNVGDTVTINSGLYVMIKMPVQTFDSSVYHITYPVRKDDLRGAYSYDDFYISKTLVEPSTYGYNNGKIGSYQVRVWKNVKQVLRYNVGVDNVQKLYTLSESGLFIKLGNTVIGLDVQEGYGGLPQNIASTVTVGDYDFTDDIDVNSYSYRNYINAQRYDDFIDYIKIEKIN